MQNFKNYVIIGLSIACAILFIRGCKDVETITIETDVYIEVPVPVVEKVFDTIREPYPVYVKSDTVRLTKYINASDSLQQSMYEEAVTIREYNEKFEDDYIVGNVYSKTTGTLDAQSFEYKTKPRTVIVDTTITQEIKVPYKNKLFIGGELGMPLQKYDEVNESIIRNNLKARVNFGLDTKNIIYNTAIDSDRYLWLGVNYKF
tara:strand:+ start:33350 stop:33958 length:609 start_codon:yes stop_codon:yes gene_type:complete